MMTRMMTRKKRYPALKKKSCGLFHQQQRFSVAGRAPFRLFPAGLYETVINSIIPRSLATGSLLVFLLMTTVPVSEAQAAYEPDASPFLPVISDQDLPSLKSLNQRPELNHLSRMPVLPTGSENLLPQFDEKSPERSPLWEPRLHAGPKEIETASEEEQYRQELEKEVEARKNVEATQGYKAEDIPILTPPVGAIDSQQSPPPDSLIPEDADSGQSSKSGSSKTADSDTQEQAAAGDSSTGDSETQDQPESGTPSTSNPQPEGTRGYRIIYVSGNFQADSRTCEISTHPATSEEGEDPQHAHFLKCQTTSQLDEELCGDPPTFRFNDSPQKHFLSHIDVQMKEVINRENAISNKHSSAESGPVVVNIDIITAGIASEEAYNEFWKNKHRGWLIEELTTQVSTWNEQLKKVHSGSTLTIYVWIESDQNAYYDSLTDLSKDGTQAVLLSESNALLITHDGQETQSEVMESEHHITPWGGMKHLGKAMTLYCDNPENPEECRSELKKAVLDEMPNSLKDWNKVAGLARNVGKLNAAGRATLEIKRSPKCNENLKLKVEETIDKLCRQELENIVKLAEKCHKSKPYDNLLLTGPFIQLIYEKLGNQTDSYVMELKSMLSNKIPGIKVIPVPEKQQWERFESYVSSFHSENPDFSVSSASDTKEDLTEHRDEED